MIGVSQRSHPKTAVSLPARVRMWAAVCCRAAMLCVAVLFLARGAAALAEESPRIKRIFVRADQPKSWPDGFRPIGVDEYRRLIDSTAHRAQDTSTAWIERAEYSAVVIGNQLSRTRMTARIRSAAGEPELLILDPMNLVPADLEWSERPADENAAVWGTAPDGRLALLVDGQGGELAGRWDLAGRTFGDNVEFEVRVPPAAVSVLELQIPADERLTCSAGDVTDPQAGPEPGWNIWRVLLGSKTACRLTIHRPKRANERPPLLVVDQAQSCIIRDEGLALQTMFLNLEAYGSPVKTLAFHLPADVEVERLTYGGDAELAWNSEKSGGYQRVVVDFPIPLEGRARTIRLLAFAPTRLGEVWRIPEITLHDASTLSLRTNIKVEEPLEIRALKHPGYRQVDADASSLTFERHAADARITLEVDRPRTRPSAQIATRVFADGQECSMVSAVTWQTRAGRLFEVRCNLSPQWEITEVRAQIDGGMPLLTNWDVRSQPGGERTFLLQLPKTLTPQTPQSVLIHATRLSAYLGQRLELPAVTPLDCSSVERMVVVEHPPAYTAVLEQVKGFEVLGEVDIPDYFRKASLDGLRAGENVTAGTLALHSVDPDSTAAVALRSSDPPFDAQSETVVEVDLERIVETTQITVRPKDAGVDRVTVYLTTGGASTQWQAVGGGNSPVTAQLLTKERHADGELPDGKGELWELRLPAPQKSEFRIVSSRTAASAYTHQPALAIVPGAQQFSGTVSLHAPAQIELDLDANGLRPTESAPAEPESNNADAQSEARTLQHERRRSWSYDSAGGQLVVRILDKRLSESSTAPAALTIRSIIEPGGQGDDIHWATYRVAADSQPLPFRFSLPPPARLVDIRLNGRAVPRSDKSEHVLPVLPEGRENVVEIQYRCPTERRFAFDTRQIVLPRCSLPVLDVSWKIALAPQLRLAAVPRSMSLAEPLPEIRWTKRLFGPLGQITGSTRFHPFSAESWTNLFAAGRTPPPAAAGGSAARFPPPGRVVFHVQGARLPLLATLRMWDSAQTGVLSWVVLLGCLLVGLVMKIRQVRYRRIVAVIVLLAAPMICLSAPAAIAQILGGCFGAALIAVLLPRSLLQPARKPADSLEASSVSTTVHFPVPSSSFYALLIALTALTVATAQEATLLPESEQVVPPRRQQKSDQELPVLIPVDENLKPLPSTPFVYVTDEFIQRLQALDSARSRLPNYLITAADYVVRIGERDTAAMEARYQVAVLSKSSSTAVVLPITDAELILPDACLVNGRPQEVLPGPDGRGFVVELLHETQTAEAPAGELPGDPSGPTAGSPEESPVRDDGQPLVSLFDVVLRMQPRTESLLGGGSLGIGVPRVASSQIRVEFPRDYPVLDVLGDSGRLVVERSRDNLTAALGLTDQLTVNWSTSDESVRAQVEASVLRFVEIHPARLEYRYRVSYRVLRGSVAYLEWDVPARTIVRRLAGGFRNHLTRRPAGSETDRLRIDLGNPHDNEFLIDAALMVPLDSGQGGVIVPLPALHGSDEQWADVRTTANQVGLGTTSGYQLSADDSQATPPAGPAAGSTLRQEASAVRLAEPEFAYQLDASTSLRFQLKPLAARRRVLQNQEIHVRRNRLDWKFTADVTIDRAPVFQHLLQVDPRLQIDSISVNQGGAERLAHWSRERGELTLFLSGPGKDVQDVVVTGSVKLQTPVETPLPLVAFDSADIDDSQIVLYHDPDVAVELVDLERVTRAEATTPERTDEDPRAFAGRYRLQSGQPLPRIRIRRATEAASAEMAVLARNHADPAFWSITTALRFGEASAVPSPLRLILPPEWNNSYQLNAAAEQEVDSLPDGSLQVTLRPASATDQGFSVTVTADVQAPPNSEWRLPLLFVQDLAPRANYLLLDSNGPWALRDSPAELLPADAVPEWIADLLGPESVEPPVQAFRSEARLEPVLHNESRSRRQGASVPLVETRLWLGRNGETLGSTRLIVIPRTSRTLTIARPRGTTLRGLFVDGEAIEQPDDADPELTVPLQPGAVPQRILMSWKRASPSGVPRMGFVTQQCPRPQGVAVEHSLVAVVPPPGARLLAQQGIVGIDAVELATCRLEALLSAVQHDARSDAGRSWAWRSLMQGDEWLQHYWDRAVETDEAHQSAWELKRRYNDVHMELRMLLSKLPKPAAPSEGDERGAPSIGPFGESLIGLPHAESESVVYGRLIGDGSTYQLRYVCFDSSLLTGLMVAGGFILVVPVSRRLLRGHLDEWLAGREPLAWMLLGVVWWMCLRPSWFGLVLLLFALAQAIRNHRRRRDVDDFELSAM